jgi:hypothetical protein
MCGREEHKRKRDRSGIGVGLLRQRTELGLCSIGRRFFPLQDWDYERDLRSSG